MSDTILENLSHCPFMGLGLICQNCFRKMLKVENNNSLLTDITVHQISVHTSDDDLHCCTNFDKFQSHCSRVRTGQGLICQANIKQGKMKEAVAAVAYFLLVLSPKPLTLRGALPHYLSLKKELAYSSS